MEDTSLRGEEEGVSVVLGAVLLLAILIVAIPPIYNHYIKTSMTSNESSHMEEVRKQFLELQSKASWMNQGDSGIVRFPMNAESVSLSPGQSPLGTLQTHSGSEIEVGSGGGGGPTELVENGDFSDGVEPWENVEVVSVENHNQNSALISYDSVEGNGSIMTYILSAKNMDPAEEEAYWYQPMKSISPENTITLNGAFKKSITNGGGGIDHATVRVEVEDGEDNWVTILEDTGTTSPNGWENFSEVTYTVKNGVDNVRCYMHARGTGGSGGGESDTTVNLWMDDISAMTGDVKEPPAASEEITIDPGSIRFLGHNIYYPDQTYAFEGGHVIMMQDGVDQMVSSKQDLIGWEDGLKVDYCGVAMENSSISSTGSEALTVEWGGRKRFPENEKWENAGSLRINFETQYKSVWESYLEKKAGDLNDYVDNAWGGSYENGAYLQIENNENIKYFVSATEVGGESDEPSVKTLQNGIVTDTTAVLKMRYNFKDYAYGEVRFEWKKESSESWSNTGWEKEYGRDNYSVTITGLSPGTRYQFRGQLKYDGGVKKGSIKSLKDVLYYNGDAVARDEPRNPDPEDGGVEFSITNIFSTTATVDNIEIDPQDDSINGLSDKVGDGNDEPGETEVYAESNENGFSDYPDGTDIPDTGLLVDIGTDGDLNNSGHSPAVDSSSTMTFYLYEFYYDYDYGWQNNVNMSGKKIDITLEYLVDGRRHTKSFTITPS